MIQRIFITIVLLLTVTLGACSITTSESVLQNTTWLLESYGWPNNLIATLGESDVIIEFDGDGKYQGFDGCNT